MRHSLVGMLALAAASLTGCFTTPANQGVGRYDARVPFAGLSGDDAVQLDVFLVEQPTGDRCINHDAWELADEQVLGDRKPRLEENGLRAGLLGATPPDELRALLRSERSCPNPRRLLLHAGNPAVLVLGPVAPHLAFQLRQDGRSTGVELDQAQCVLQVTPRTADDGRLVLHCVPAVRHGDEPAMPRPVRDPSGALRWDVPTDRPTEYYAGLAWDLTAAPNTCVACGALLDHPGTFGAAGLLSAEAPWTQRLLILRVGRPGCAAPLSGDAGGMAEGRPDDGAAKSPPLALQAGAAGRRIDP